MVYFHKGYHRISSGASEWYLIVLALGAADSVWQFSREGYDYCPRWHNLRVQWQKPDTKLRFCILQYKQFNHKYFKSPTPHHGFCRIQYISHPSLPLFCLSYGAIREVIKLSLINNVLFNSLDLSHYDLEVVVYLKSSMSYCCCRYTLIPSPRSLYAL